MARTDFVGNRITADNITDEAEGYGVVHSGALSGNFTGETTFQDNVFHIKTATNGGAVYGGAMANAAAHLQVSSFKKEKNARKQYRKLLKKYPELRGKTPEYKQVDVKGKGRRVRTYVAGKNKELKNLCQKMHGDLKNTCLIGK